MTRSRPQFDNKISMGTVINVITVLGSIGAFMLLTGERQKQNTTAIQELKTSVDQDVRGLRSTVNTAVTRIQTAVDQDIEEVVEEIEQVEGVVDQALTQQATADMRMRILEEEHGEYTDLIRSNREIAIQVRSETARDRAVQAERHEALVGTLEQLQRAITGSDGP